MNLNQKEMTESSVELPSYELLINLLSEDLDFHGQDSSYSSHNFHSFPAKFPPQLPRKFIEKLTCPGDIVLDPMMGSGTTVLEAFILGRFGLGFDIDPLAILLCKTKITSLNIPEVFNLSSQIIHNAKISYSRDKTRLEKELAKRWDKKTKDFVNYWFAIDTQMALQALQNEINEIVDEPIRNFFTLAFSAIIITKSGGISLALDLAHTRPHRAKIVFDQSGHPLIGMDLISKLSEQSRYMFKKLRSPFDEFEKRVFQNLKGLPLAEDKDNQIHFEQFFKIGAERIAPRVSYGDAQNLNLLDNTVDLIVTSPPYASNAIDYMRAHKFSLVWFGHSIEELGIKRNNYIGGEAAVNFVFEELPVYTSNIVNILTGKNKKKGMVLHRYFSEMHRALKEMYRVLKPGKSALIVVGNSTICNKDTETQNCLADIGRNIGFHIAGIGIRRLDRNRRMMPSGTKTDFNSQIQKRMHKEYVIGFVKPQSSRVQ